MEPAYLKLDSPKPHAPSRDHPGLDEISSFVSCSVDLGNGPRPSRRALNRHLHLHGDLVVTHQVAGRMVGAAIASDYGLRAVISTVALVQDCDRESVSKALLRDVIFSLARRDVRRILIRGYPPHGEDHLRAVGFKHQRGESFLNLNLHSDELRLICGAGTSKICVNNPWLNPTEFGSITRSENLVSEVIQKAASIKGIQLAPWEDEGRLLEFVRSRGLLLGHVLDDLLSFGFFAHSGIDGIIFHVGRLSQVRPRLTGLGVGLVELGVGYLAAQGLDRVVLCTDNPSSTSFWQKRGWNLEAGVNLWQLDR